MSLMQNSNDTTNGFGPFHGLLTVYLIRVCLLLVTLLVIQACSRDEEKRGKRRSDLEERPWHGIERTIRYNPEDGDFVITNGALRFNRALYGTNTAFRIEAGDLPEFALYLPGIGGNFKLGLIAQDTSLWLIDAGHIETRYRPGSMLYEIRDPLLGGGTIRLTLLARADAEGMVLKLESQGVDEGISLLWAYGGASGKRFSRSGDLGADPESVFYLQPEYCEGNNVDIRDNRFILQFTSVRNGEQMEMSGVAPPGGRIKTCSAGEQDSPSRLLASDSREIPVVVGTLALTEKEEQYFMVSRGGEGLSVRYEEVAGLFDAAEKARRELAGRVSLRTPDPYVNNLGGALAVAADAIWEEPSFLHGAVAWRMRLPGWRGAYAGDWLGWHDRARIHFEAYARSQYTDPPSGPNAPDPETHLARQVEEKGNSLFTEGYISRNPGRISDPHHYDMNLVWIDQLLWHIRWTGDLEFARQMWPVIRRHLAWEKRCFDANGDGLYDAYAAIWASDALQYSGGGVTHSSAYNYRANKFAARIAVELGEDPAPYISEAEKIDRAVSTQLWIPEKGWYGEFKDLLGRQRVHPFPAVWTIYHVIDAGMGDPFMQWQSLHYIDRHIPRIPVRARGLPEGSWYTLSNSNWMPYTWSINNVALAENMHTALANWQAGRRQEAFILWKSQILESMYLGSSPGNLQQLSSYDAFRGELYRDFADPVGVTARTLVEGLFGWVPDALKDTLTIRPGFPAEWEYATLETPDLYMDYQRRGNRELYTIRQHLPETLNLRMIVPALKSGPVTVSVNGEETAWSSEGISVGEPAIRIEAPAAASYDVVLHWRGEDPVQPEGPLLITEGENLEVELRGTSITGVHDPQQVLDHPVISGSSLRSALQCDPGHYIFFLQLAQGELTWWLPVELNVRPQVEVKFSDPAVADQVNVTIVNNTPETVSGALRINGQLLPAPEKIIVAPGSESAGHHLPEALLVPGTNRVTYVEETRSTQGELTVWEPPFERNIPYRPIDLAPYFNDRVTRIFENRYLTPRSPYPTLQLPWQGIGDWASYAKTPIIDDTGLRRRAGEEDTLRLRQGIPVRTPGRGGPDNIIFTSLWDNYPDEVTVPLSGSASHAYLLMAGSTHHMQSRIANGEVIISYADGTSDQLELVNPGTWWPIEQDYYEDGFAFNVGAPRPPRLHLKDGSEPPDPYPVLARNRTNLIEGGAATLLDLPLDPGKVLSGITIRTLSNDVVIGLMALTLVTGG